MKLAVIGGGSSYTPELLDGLFSRVSRIPVTEVWLMDQNEERLGINVGFSRRMAEHHGNPFTVHGTTSMREAVRDARYVITQIRVGGMQARINDEKLGLRHGIIGQETTGVGGFACALRTIPRILEVAHAMEELAPDGFLVNFTNPAGINTEAVARHSRIRSVGLCNVPIGIIMDTLKYTGGEVGDLELDYVGLNHLSWVRRFLFRGKDITEQVIETFIERQADEEWPDPVTRSNMITAMRRLRMFCNYYLQYYYSTDSVLETLKRKPKTRGEEVVEVEQALFRKYQDPGLTEKPEELGKRGGAHYSTAAFMLIEAVENDLRNRQIVCVRNGGAVPTFDADASVEIPAIIGKNGAVPIPQPAPEPVIRGLMQNIKAYETLTVQAAVTGNREAAFEAMLLHPLMPSADGCVKLLEELLEINRPYLQGTFFSGARKNSRLVPITPRRSPMAQHALTHTGLSERQPDRCGKVRDIYDLGDTLLIVATDRLSAFDWVNPVGIPDKGRILTQISLFWFEQTADLCRNHLITADIAEFPEPFRRHPEQFAGRSMLVRKCRIFPVEVIIRGYLAGSGLKEYRQKGTVCGIPLPPGLREADELPHPLYTPSTKAEAGHDENISPEEASRIIGEDWNRRIQETALAIYSRARNIARERGIILCDTKFEFGELNGELVLADEVLTPDSSRFWPAESYEPGKSQPSFDKQYVRDYLESVHWDKNSPPPPLPEDVVARTRAKYVEAYERLTGRKFE